MTDCDGWGCATCADQLRDIAQNDFMVDGKYLPTGQTLMQIAQRIAADNPPGATVWMVYASTPECDGMLPLRLFETREAAHEWRASKREAARLIGTVLSYKELEVTR